MSASRDERSNVASAGCDLISGQTAITTTSQHNMERAGLRIAYTKALWTPTA